MIKCSFCETKINLESLPEGWGKAKGEVGNNEFDIVFCPKHRKEAEKKLDLIFTKFQ